MGNGDGRDLGDTDKGKQGDWEERCSQEAEVLPTELGLVGHHHGANDDLGSGRRPGPTWALGCCQYVDGDHQRVLWIQRRSVFLAGGINEQEIQKAPRVFCSKAISRALGRSGRKSMVQIGLV